MGLLSLGEPLSWAETHQHSEHVRKHGILQFLSLYRSRKSRTDEMLKWGDEIEYMVVKFDREARKVRVSCRAVELLKQLQAAEMAGEKCATLWRPEFGAYMVEGTPGEPYGIHRSAMERIWFQSAIDEDGDEDVSDEEMAGGDNPPLAEDNSILFSFLNGVEANMRLRRKEVEQLLLPDEAVMTISAFPMLGTKDFCQPTAFVDPTEGYGRSLFFPDQAIFSGHPRFRTLVNNIRERRGCNVLINVPIYRDLHTPSPFLEDYSKSINLDWSALSGQKCGEIEKIVEKREKELRQPDQIYMDAMGFGMGCCCLQVTFQAATICEARILYDQLTPLCPILMALSAASPIFRGFLTDRDCRWSVISSSVDDRTQTELTGTGQKGRIPKSRFDSVDLYLCPNNNKFNDIAVVVDEEIYKQLINEGVDHFLARHIAHLFIRDPLVIFKEKLYLDDTKENDHFENVQSTNWQTMRFKPPPVDSPEIGWRVEFRPMEVQLTDKENASYVIFIVLLTRLILSFNLDLVIPISKVDENMKNAEKRNAAREGRFWFRRDITVPRNVLSHFIRNKPDCGYTSRLSRQFCRTRTKSDDCDIHSVCELMSIDEIFNGKTSGGGQEEDNFPGLIPLLNLYLDSMEINAETRCTINSYLRLISERANGSTPTAAQLIRQFVQQQPSYARDSVVNQSIAFDLLDTLHQVQTEQISMQDFIDSIKV